MEDNRRPERSKCHSNVSQEQNCLILFDIHSVSKQTIDQITEQILKLQKNSEIVVLGPVVLIQGKDGLLDFPISGANTVSAI